MQMINTRNTTLSTVTAGATVPMGDTIHKSGCVFNNNGNAVTISGSGHYLITASVTAAPTAEGELTVSLMDNSQVIATATETAAAAGDNVNMTLVASVYSRCACLDNVISMVASAAANIIEVDANIVRL